MISVTLLKLANIPVCDFPISFFQMVGGLIMEKSFIASLFDSCLTLTAIINYLIRESEVITGKSQTEASPY